MAKQRRTFSTEFKCEVASQVIDQGYSFSQVPCSFGVAETIIRRWVNSSNKSAQIKALNMEAKSFDNNDGVIPKTLEVACRRQTSEGPEHRWTM